VTGFPELRRALRDYDTPTIWGVVRTALAGVGRTNKNTVSAYRSGVSVYVEWMRERDYDLLWPPEGAAAQYRDSLQARYKPGPVNTRLVGAAKLYWALDRLKVEHGAPFKDHPNLFVPVTSDIPATAYGESEFNAILEGAENEYDYVALLLAGNAGLTTSEILRLDWAHVTLPKRRRDGSWSGPGRLLVYGRAGKVDTAYFGGQLASALDVLPERTGPVLKHVTSPSGLRYRVKKAAVRAGLVDHARGGATCNGVPVHTHFGLLRARRRYGIDAVREGGLLVAQMALRHKTPTMTARYASETEEELAQFVGAVRRGEA